MLPSTIQLTKIHNSKKIKCDICKQKFFTKLELQNHKDVIHTSFTVMDGEENYKIEEEFNLKNNPNWLNHLEILAFLWRALYKIANILAPFDLKNGP